MRDDGRGAEAPRDGGPRARGMRERVDVHDGTLAAGPRDDGGFEVQRVDLRPRLNARVFLVDDQALVRAGFRMLIEAQPDMEVVGEAEDGRAALEALAVTRADLVLMDVRMPQLDGVQATQHLLAALQRSPGAEGHRAHHLRPRRVRVRRDPRRGERVPAQGLPPRGAAGGMRTVLSGDAVVAPSATRRLLDHVTDALPGGTGEDPRLELLTAREREVLLEVARGRSNAEIAADLFMAEATVKTHVGRLLAKLDQRDRVQLAVFAYETGLVRAGR